MIVTYDEKFDTFCIYYYDYVMQLNVICVYEDSSAVTVPSAFVSFKDIRRVYRDEIIHDDNIN